MRPKAYAQFDLKTDFMHAVNPDRENEINKELEELQKDSNHVTSAFRRDELLAAKAICRVKVQVLPENFNGDMELLSEEFSKRLYGKIKAINSVEKLQQYKATMDKHAWEVHDKNGIPPCILADFADYFHERKFETAGDRLRFLQSSATVYFAILQKYIFVRMIEL